MTALAYIFGAGPVAALYVAMIVITVRMWRDIRCKQSQSQ
jgi:hypothetical protein